MGDYGLNDDYAGIYGIQATGPGYQHGSVDDDPGDPSSGNYHSNSRASGAGVMATVSVVPVGNSTGVDKDKGKANNTEEPGQPLDTGEGGGEEPASGGGLVGGAKLKKVIKGDVEQLILVQGVKETVLSETPINSSSSSTDAGNNPKGTPNLVVPANVAA